MSFPKKCPYCGADRENLFGWIEKDYLKIWECKKCKKRFEREFEMNDKRY
ncbi:hypothetical protein AB0Y20_11790 [Heyndrickxia oleronia]|jgi:transposase-like protein